MRLARKSGTRMTSMGRGVGVKDPRRKGELELVGSMSKLPSSSRPNVLPNLLWIRTNHPLMQGLMFAHTLCAVPQLFQDAYYGPVRAFVNRSCSWSLGAFMHQP